MYTSTTKTQQDVLLALTLNSIYKIHKCLQFEVPENFLQMCWIFKFGCCHFECTRTSDSVTLKHKYENTSSTQMIWTKSHSSQAATPLVTEEALYSR